MSRKRAAVRASDIAPELAQLSRRRLLTGGPSLGALTLLTGCDPSSHSGVDAALSTMLEFDDRVQAALFNPNRLAETYPASAIARPFRILSGMASPRRTCAVAPRGVRPGLPIKPLGPLRT